MKTLERRIGLASVIAISMGAMMGSGLFVLPGLAVSIAGTDVWLAYLCAGLLVIPAALSKSELSTAMPVSGGTYVFIDRAFGPLTGTIAGMGLWMSLLLKSSFALVGFGAYLDVLVDVPLVPTALMLLVAIVALNMLGVRKVGKVQIFVVTIALACLGVLSSWAFSKFDSTRLDLEFTEDGGFIAAIAFVYISYAGVTKVAAVAEEVKNPARNLPLGIMLSLLAVTALYTVVTLAMVGTVPIEDLDGSLQPVYELGRTVGGEWIGIGAAALGVMTMTSMANSGLLASSRFPFAMSRDHLLPSPLAKINERFHTPFVSIILTAALMALAISFLDVARIAKLAGSAKIVAFILVNSTVIVLRESHAQWYKPPFKTPYYPYLQIVGIVSGLVLLVVMGYEAILALLAMAVPGALMFFIYGRPRADRKGAFGRLGPRKDLLLPTPQTLETALPGEAAVVVPVFGQERSPEMLVEIGASLADGQKVEVLHVTDLPEVIDVGVMLEGDAGVESLGRRLTAMAEDRKLDIEFDAVLTRDVARTVNDVASKVHCQWVVMEWHGRTGQGISLFNPLGWFLGHLPANLALFTNAGVRYVREILVYPEPGLQDDLVVETADHLAGVFGAKLTFVRFVSDKAEEGSAAAELEYLEELADLCRDKPRLSIVRGRREVDSIAEVTSAHDLLVMSAPEKYRLIDSLLGGATEDRIAGKASCSVLRVKTPRERSGGEIDHRRVRQSLPGFQLDDSLEEECLHAKLSIVDRAALIEHIAASFAGAIPDLGVEPVRDALLTREQMQHTAVGHGIGLPHATIPGIDRVYLGVFTTKDPIEYGDEEADIFFVILGPPEERSTHLLMLSTISRNVLQSDLLERLRAATSATEIRAAFEDAGPPEDSGSDLVDAA